MLVEFEARIILMNREFGIVQDQTFAMTDRSSAEDTLKASMDDFSEALKVMRNKSEERSQKRVKTINDDRKSPQDKS
jgi:CHASE3 domain sensor protein